MRFKKLFCCFCCLLFISCSCFFCGCKSSVQTSPKQFYSVVIDAGHGGIDAGVIGTKTGVKESDINLAITRLIADCFKNAGFKVTLTRNTQAGLYGSLKSGFKMRDMACRAQIIKQANPTLIISVHQNFFSMPSRRGAQVFYQKGESKSKEFAQSLQKSLNGMPQAVRSCSILSGDFYLLKVLPCPSVIVECGFLSNSSDEELLISPDYQAELANFILEGTLNYLASAKD